jgi:hypothetical protein
MWRNGQLMSPWEIFIQKKTNANGVLFSVFLVQKGRLKNKKVKINRKKG